MKWIVLQRVRNSPERFAIVSSVKSPYVFFQEVQQFRKSGLFTALLAGSAVATIAGFLLWLNFPPKSSGGAQIPLLALGIGTVSALAVLILVLCAKLTTEVNRSGLYIQYFPFHLSPRRIPLEHVILIEIKTYRPLRDYGGYGIRYNAAGKAYNVSGDRGVNLKFTTGRDLLIGSQRPEELAKALQQLRPNCKVSHV
jgi:Family of unknown function (DUF6141)